jgi:hypothetical protein
MDDEREERRVDVTSALIKVTATLGEQGRLLSGLVTKMDKLFDLLIEIGRWQAGHEAMTGEHQKTIDGLGCQAGEFVERLTEAEKQLERHGVRIAVLWAIVGVLGTALAIFGIKVFAGHFVKEAALMVTGGTTVAAFGWQKAILALKGLL